MARLVLPVTILFLFLSCNNPDSNAVTAAAKELAQQKTNSKAAVTDYLEKEADSLVIPSFSIEVNLSSKAAGQLAAQHETIIVAALFSGQPRDTTSREYAESGEMFVQTAQKELSSDRIAKFENIKFPAARYDSLADKDISLLVNIFSGRKTSSYNLLDCAILSEKMSIVKGRQFPLACKLIGETDSLQNK